MTIMEVTLKSKLSVKPTEEAVIASPQTDIIRKPIKDKLGRSYATGKRKRAVARVWIKPGKGSFTVFGKQPAEYFNSDLLVNSLFQPLKVSNAVGTFDVVCTVSGGGITGQVSAIVHGLAKALVNFDPEYHTSLKPAGLLTRDSRKVERKKYGMPKARKKRQFSKR